MRRVVTIRLQRVWGCQHIFLILVQFFCFIRASFTRFTGLFEVVCFLRDSFCQLGICPVSGFPRLCTLTL